MLHVQAQPSDEFLVGEPAVLVVVACCFDERAFNRRRRCSTRSAAGLRAAGRGRRVGRGCAMGHAVTLGVRLRGGVTRKWNPGGIFRRSRGRRRGSTDGQANAMTTTTPPNRKWILRVTISADKDGAYDAEPRLRRRVALVALLRKHRADQEGERAAARQLWSDEGWVFATRTVGPINPNTDYHEWKDLLKAAGLREARLHDARHTAATVLLILGQPERTVMSLMGWSSAGMTTRYQHLTDGIRTEVAAGWRSDLGSAQ